MNKTIEDLVVKLSHDPHNPELNFACAVEYERLNQTASAVSFYLRCAEYGYESHKLLTYNSLLRMARCFEDQTDRQYTVSNCILQAMTVLPERPEAYFMLSQFHEKSQAWQECYTYAELGLTKHVGISIYTPDQISQEILDSSVIKVIQLPLNLLSRKTFPTRMMSGLLENGYQIGRAHV